MAPTREIVKRRIGPSGLDVKCDADERKYVDIKETKKIRYKRGKGTAYQKTRYTLLIKDGEGDRTYEDPVLRIKNAEDEDQFIDYQRGVLNKIKVAAGRGTNYIKTVIRFDNSEDNDKRKIREQRINGVGGHIVVERIENFKLSHARGVNYQQKKVHLLNDEENINNMDGPCKIGEDE